MTPKWATVAENNPNQLFTRREAAEYLGVKEQTLALWASTGRYALPFCRVGSRVRYRRGDLDGWLASRTTTRTVTID